MIDANDCGGNWWNEWVEGKPKYSKIACHSGAVHHRSHMSGPGLEPEHPRWEAGDSPPADISQQRYFCCFSSLLFRYTRGKLSLPYINLMDAAYLAVWWGILYISGVGATATTIPHLLFPYCCLMIRCFLSWHYCHNESTFPITLVRLDVSTVGAVITNKVSY
jgi:hypothetical protein